MINPLTDLPLPVVIACLTEALKRAGLPAIYLPFAAMIWGAILGLLADFSLLAGTNGLLVGLLTTMGVAVVDSRLEKLNQ